MNNSTLSKEEMISKINELESKINILKKEKENNILRERERIITEEKLEFSWAGNLGRWDWDYRTGDVAFNPLKVQTLGYQMQEVESKVDWFTAQIHPDDYDKAMNNMREHLIGEKPAYEVEYRMKTKDGSYKWFYDRGKVVERDPEGKPVRLTGIVFDITDRKQSEIELREAKEKLEIANQTKDKFFSIIAHDLRSPILTIMSFIEMLQKVGNDISENDFKEMLSEIEDSVKSTEALLDNLLKWAMTQINQITLNKETRYLSDYRNFIQQNLNDSAQNKNIKLNINFPENLEINADFNMLSTVLRNLINNAIKFSNKESEINISAFMENTDIIFEVQDFGIGIPESGLRNLFELNSSYKQRGTANEKGTGLGLKLCYEFVNMHGGLIEANSELSKGSTFRFNIPQ